MRIAFIDHSLHRRTRSAEFLVEEVLAGHAIDRYWDTFWEDGKPLDVAPILAAGYDRIVVMQVDGPAFRLVERGARNVVFVPMWDGADLLSPRDWRRLEGARILSFCHALHQTVRQAGLPSIYAQYWPDPERFPPVEDFSTLRGFFWKRQPRVSWKDVRTLVGDTPFERLHVHVAHDGAQADEAVEPSADGRVTVSSWFEDPAELQALLGRHNVYFAPRTLEGIGFSFLEAMCKGMAVVAADQPTMNEYITDGVNGLLWPLDDPRALDFSDAARLGRAARESAFAGRARWEAALSRVRDFALGTELGERPAEFDYSGFLGGRRGGSATAGVSSMTFPAEESATPLPSVTIAIVTYNSAPTVEATLKNVLAQDHPTLDVVVVDGASTDGTKEILERYRDRLSSFVSEADEGPYFAMNKAARLARGDYILFMNAGDWFIGDGAVREALSRLPAGDPPDFVLGHHIYRSESGEALRRAADFELTWQRLKDGRIDGHWLAGIPCHQATFTRTRRLAEEGYDTTLRIVADHEFLYRKRQAGARFHHSDTLISVYTSGGMSYANRELCYSEWKTILGRYGDPAAAERLHGALVRDLEHQALGRPNYRLDRVQDLSAKWRRSLNLRRDMFRVRRSGLFFDNWYEGRNPEAKRTRGGPLRHYLRHGVYEYRDPSPFFDTRYYLLAHETARKSELTPLVHYMAEGARANLSTTPWFDALWAEIAASAPAGATPLARMIGWFGATPAEELLATCHRAGVEIGDERLAS